MMPKGVEHNLKAVPNNQPGLEVRIPMMPKGVEHSTNSFGTMAKFLVRIPMMPKGVEHKSKSLRG